LKPSLLIPNSKQMVCIVCSVICGQSTEFTEGGFLQNNKEENMSNKLFLEIMIVVL